MVSSWRSAFPGMWEILGLFSHKSESPGKRAGRKDVFRGSRSQSLACFGCMKSFFLSEERVMCRLPRLDTREKNSLKDKSGVGMNFAVHWSHYLWKSSRAGIWMWHLRTWFRGDEGWTWSPWRSLPILMQFCASCWLRIIQIWYIIYIYSRHVGSEQHSAISMDADQRSEMFLLSTHLFLKWPNLSVAC